MTNRAIALLAYPVALAIVLNACGGGTAGMGPVPSATSTAQQPAQPAAKAVPVNFQAAGTTAAYQIASATATVPDAGAAGALIKMSGQGGSITLTVDAGSNLIKIAVDIPTTAGRPLAFQIDQPARGSVSLMSQTGQVTPFVRDIFGYPESPPSIYGGTTAFLLSQMAGGKSLSSAAYGIWGASDMTGLAGPAGAFALGNLTNATAVPATGSATFNGTTMGEGGVNGTTVYALVGDAQIIANFATQSVTTNLTNLSSRHILTEAASPLPDLAGTSAISGNAYSGSISGGALTGSINGNFYGSAAQETAGVWQASGGGSTWIGSFGAK